MHNLSPLNTELANARPVSDFIYVSYDHAVASQITANVKWGFVVFVVVGGGCSPPPPPPTGLLFRCDPVRFTGSSNLIIVIPGLKSHYLSHINVTINNQQRQ